MDGFTVSNANRFLETGRMTGESTTVPSAKVESGEKSFSETLKEAVGTVNQLQIESNQAAQELATGRTDNIAEVMIKAEKADIALRLMMQVRNKIIDAYQEIMKMQV